MYRCTIENVTNINQYEELIKVFLSPENYEIVHSTGDESVRTFTFDGDKDKLKRSIYKDLEEYTGLNPKWGILTGIRPVKLAGELLKELGSMDAVKAELEKKYLLSQDKIELVTGILSYQRDKAGLPTRDSLSIYIGIPFCPTRCLYCSFTSNQVKDREIDRYLVALHKEIEYAGKAVQKEGSVIESIYIGGGTPTTLNPVQLEELLSHVEESFHIKLSPALREFTVEAGRPDTISGEKLEVMKSHSVDRISINPQSMKEVTLQTIGRNHTNQQVIEGFKAAKEVGIEVVNADLIAGLPGESLEDFEDSLRQVIELGAANITLHTLAVKRASRLKEMDEEYNYKNQDLREAMLDLARETLDKQGFKPYYLYRQKHTSGSTENIGFCRDDKLSVYNIRIMEEAQSILALGAGGISKIYFPDENRLERVPNVSNYEIYIDRIDEMIDRKDRGFFIKSDGR